MGKTIQEQLLQLQDEKYRQFQCRLMPTVLPENVIGIRTPVLRRYAKNIAGTEEAEAFLKQLPHRYYEEKICMDFCWKCTEIIRS